MSSLVVVTYPDEHRAAEVMATLQRLHGEYLIDIADGCVVTKDKRGHIKLHRIQHLSTEGAKEGTAWGVLLGALFAFRSSSSPASAPSASSRRRPASAPPPAPSLATTPTTASTTRS